MAEVDFGAHDEHARLKQPLPPRYQLRPVLRHSDDVREVVEVDFRVVDKNGGPGQLLPLGRQQ